MDTFLSRDARTRKKKEYEDSCKITFYIYIIIKKVKLGQGDGKPDKIH